jgi:hypothetical protein
MSKTLMTCKLGNHKYDVQKVGTGFFYTDEKHGVSVNTPACPTCFLSHLQKYYPQSPVTIALTKRAA